MVQSIRQLVRRYVWYRMPIEVHSALKVPRAQFPVQSLHNVKREGFIRAYGWLRLGAGGDISEMLKQTGVIGLCIVVLVLESMGKAIAVGATRKRMEAAMAVLGWLFVFAAICDIFHKKIIDGSWAGTVWCCILADRF